MPVVDSSCKLSTRTASMKYPLISKEPAAAYTLRANGIHPPCGHYEASHICGNSRCVVRRNSKVEHVLILDPQNINHLSWELPWDNISRWGCHRLPRHFAECPHDPKCITPVLTDEQVQASLAAATLTPRQQTSGSGTSRSTSTLEVPLTVEQIKKREANRRYQDKKVTSNIPTAQ